MLADYGYNAKLIENKNAVKTPDSSINDIMWEIKTNRTATKSAIDNSLRAGNTQSRNLILNIKSNISDEDIKSVLKNRIRRTNLEKIIIERDGKIHMMFFRKELI